MRIPVHKVGDPAPSPLPRRSEAEVMARWQGDKPVVSIKCATYQHVGFIEDALRGFLGQDTDFPFEILVRDDASTDGTADIVRDYAERFPNIIRAVLETENRYPEVKAAQVFGRKVRGEFIASCEGDDYWIASDFLGEAVRALEGVRSDGVRAVVGDCLVVNNGTISGFERPKRDDWNWYFPIRALVRTNTSIPKIEHVFGDTAIALEVQRTGWVEHLDRFVAVYRRHAGGIVAGLSFDELRPKLVANYASIALYLARIGELDLATKYQNHALQKVAYMLQPYGVVPPSPPSRAASAMDRLLGGIRSVTRAVPWAR